METTQRVRRTTILIAVMIASIAAAFVSWLTIRATYAPTAATSSYVSVYPKVRERGTIRAAYYVGAPYFVIDPKTGKKSGIFHDVMESAASKLGLEVEWTEEVGFGEMAEGLRAGRFDAVASGVWISPDRAKNAGFTIPILYDAVFPYVRTDDKRFDGDLGTINLPSVTISTIDGEMASVIATADYPKAKTLSLPQSTDFTQMILNVASKRADITFLALGPAEKYRRANPGQIRNLTPQHPTRVFPAAIMVPQGDYALANALNLTLAEMLNTGEIDAIISRYEEEPGAHLRVIRPYDLARAGAAK